MSNIEKLAKILKEELEVSMIFTGCKNIETIKALN